MHKYELVAIALVVLSFLTAFVVYPTLPEKVPIHWNAKGEVDGYGSPLFGAFIFPAIGVFIIFLFWLIPKIAVFKENFKKFEKEYYLLEIFLILYFIIFYILTLLPNFGFEFNMSFGVVPLVSFLFIVLGIMMPRFKRNFFVGIRTPWTLANEEVWDKTHKLGGKVFIAMGLISLLALLFPSMFLVLFMAPLIAGIAIIVIYSFIEFRKINGGKIQL